MSYTVNRRKSIEVWELMSDVCAQKHFNGIKATGGPQLVNLVPSLRQLIHVNSCSESAPFSRSHVTVLVEHLHFKNQFRKPPFSSNLNSTQRSFMFGMVRNFLL